MVSMIKTRLLEIAKDASGATAIEYAMIAASVSIVIVGVVATMSGSLLGLFNAVIGGF